MLHRLCFFFQIAIYGKNFCSAAKDAFFLIMRNVVRLVSKYLILKYRVMSLYFHLLSLSVFTCTCVQVMLCEKGA